MGSLIMTKGLTISNIRIRWHYKLNKERNNITTAHLISQILHKIEETYLEERVQEKWGFRKDRRCKKHPITGAKTNSLCPKMIATQLIIVFKYQTKAYQQIILSRETSILHKEYKIEFKVKLPSSSKRFMGMMRQFYQ